MATRATKARHISSRVMRDIVVSSPPSGKTVRYLETSSHRLPTIVWMESLTIHYKPFDSASQRATDVKIRYVNWGVALSTGVGGFSEVSVLQGTLETAPVQGESGTSTKRSP